MKSVSRRQGLKSKEDIFQKSHRQDRTSLCSNKTIMCAKYTCLQFQHEKFLLKSFILKLQQINLDAYKERLNNNINDNRNE